MYCSPAPDPTFVCRSPSMRAVMGRLPRLAQAQRTTLIHGETGSGKELVARHLHELSPRVSRPFITVHCGAMPDNLVEGELFGHERGSFTGAQQRRAGLVSAAGEGTVFLDEVNSLSAHAQSRLLRFLESGEYRPVGADRPIRSTAWIIAATNEKLDREVEEQRFRKDLLFRLDVVRVDIPPLRDRTEDILLLAERFLGGMSGVRPRLSARAERALLKHSWQGNVRELKNRVEAAALLCDGDVIEPEDLGLGPVSAAPPRLEDASPREGGGLEAQLWALVAERGHSLAAALDQCERSLILSALHQEGGNRTRAAQRLGIHVRTIFKKLAPTHP